MEADSMGLCERVAADCEAGKSSQPAIAEKHDISVSFITKLLRRRRELLARIKLPLAGSCSEQHGRRATHPV